MIRVPTPKAAILFIAGVAVLFVSGAGLLGPLLGEGGLLAAEWLFLFLPAAFFVRWGGYDPAATLLLRRPTSRGLLGGVLLLAGALPGAWAIGWLQSFVLSVPPEMQEAMRELVTADGPRRLAWLLLVLAVTPAVCEEVVFRGVLLSSTRALAPWRAVLLNGVVFGAFHLSLEAPVRFLPTVWLGIVMAWAVLRTGSLVIGSLMHLLNNATIVLLASAPGSRELVTDPQAPPPAWLLAAGAGLFALGVQALRGAPALSEGGGGETSNPIEAP